MTKKDFELIARVLSDARELAADNDDLILLDMVGRRFAAELATTNPRFDGHRFMEAAGVRS